MRSIYLCVCLSCIKMQFTVKINIINIMFFCTHYSIENHLVAPLGSLDLILKILDLIEWELTGLGVVD